MRATLALVLGRSVRDDRPLGEAQAWRRWTAAWLGGTALVPTFMALAPTLARRLGRAGPSA